MGRSLMFWKRSEGDLLDLSGEKKFWGIVWEWCTPHVADPIVKIHLTWMTPCYAGLLPWKHVISPPGSNHFDRHLSYSLVVQLCPIDVEMQSILLMICLEVSIEHKILTSHELNCRNTHKTKQQSIYLRNKLCKKSRGTKNQPIAYWRRIFHMVTDGSQPGFFVT